MKARPFDKSSGSQREPCALGGRPLISLFGRTVPEKFTPMTPRLTIIRAQDYGGRELDLIPLDAVEEAVETLLS